MQKQINALQLGLLAGRDGVIFWSMTYVLAFQWFMSLPLYANGRRQKVGAAMGILVRQLGPANELQVSKLKDIQPTKL